MELLSYLVALALLIAKKACVEPGHVLGKSAVLSIPAAQLI